MATLSEGDRQAAFAGQMAAWSARREPCGLAKADLRAALDAADDWVDANKAAFNNALPAAAQAGLTPAQKAELLMLVVARRFRAGA